MENPGTARDVMVTQLVTVFPDSNAFEAMRCLMKHRITGAPVIDDQNNYLGVFSEKCSMRILSRRAAQAEDPSAHRVRARDFMAVRLLTFGPDTDLFEAIAQLLAHGVSGAPVVTNEGEFVGVFSEKTIMSPLIRSAYEGLPTTKVASFMNSDTRRVISEDTNLLQCAQMFLETSYRRLPVLREGKLLGQVSRRDVLCQERCFHPASQSLSAKVLNEASRDETPLGPDLAEADLPEDPWTVTAFMDRQAKTITEDTDLLRVAHIFLSTPYRRLPVLRNGKLVGQISRRDLLQATHHLMKLTPRRESTLLYESSLHDRSETRFA